METKQDKYGYDYLIGFDESDIDENGVLNLNIVINELISNLKLEACIKKYGSKVKTILLGPDIHYIGNRFFKNFKNLEKIDLDDMTDKKRYMFEVNEPLNVERYAFSLCKNLKEIRLPNEILPSDISLSNLTNLKEVVFTNSEGDGVEISNAIGKNKDIVKFSNLEYVSGQPKGVCKTESMSPRYIITDNDMLFVQKSFMCYNVDPTIIVNGKEFLHKEELKLLEEAKILDNTNMYDFELIANFENLSSEQIEDTINRNVKKIKNLKLDKNQIVNINFDSTKITQDNIDKAIFCVKCIKDKGLDVNFTVYRPMNVNDELNDYYLYNDEKLNLLSELNKRYKELTGSEISYAEFVYTQLDSTKLKHSDILSANKNFKDIVTDFKSANFTPAEAVIAIHDKLGKFNYSAAELTTNYFDIRHTGEETRTIGYALRDVDGTYKNNQIVCVAYSILFKNIVDALNIPNLKCDYNMCEVLKFAPSGLLRDRHINNIITLNDESYGIKGSYMNDVTWDAKVAFKKEDGFVFAGDKNFDHCLFLPSQYNNYKNGLFVYEKIEDVILRPTGVNNRNKKIKLMFPKSFLNRSSYSFGEEIEKDKFVEILESVLRKIGTPEKYVEDDARLKMLNSAVAHSNSYTAKNKAKTSKQEYSHKNYLKLVMQIREIIKDYNSAESTKETLKMLIDKKNELDKFFIKNYKFLSGKENELITTLSVGMEDVVAQEKLYRKTKNNGTMQYINQNDNKKLKL